MVIKAPCNNTSGLPRDNILRNWLENDLELSGSSSKISVIDDRLKAIDNKYSEYAPLGAALARLEREVLVNEKEYLSTLHGLNLAKLRKQNIELANNLSMIDAPFFPLKPLPGKRLLLLVVSLLAGIALVLGTILANYFLDNTIKTTYNATKFSKRDVIAALPNFEKLSKGVDNELLKNNLCKQIEGSLAVKFFEYQVQDHQPKNINIFSHKDKEGATYFSVFYALHLVEEGYKVALYLPEYKVEKLSNFGPKFSNSGIDIHSYKSNKNYMAALNVSGLANSGAVNTNYDFVLYLLHNLSNYQIPANIINGSDINLMILDASRVWLASDSHIVDLYEKACKKPAQIILNKVSESNLEGIYGEIPKIRSAFRVLIKRVLLRN